MLLEELREEFAPGASAGARAACNLFHARGCPPGKGNYNREQAMCFSTAPTLRVVSRAED